MTITLTSLRALGSGDEISVSIEIADGTNKEIKKLIILSSQYTSLNIGRGEISREQFDEIERAEKIASAYKKGLYLLGYGACSRKKLKFKLKTKGFDDEVANEAVEMLMAVGYLNENSDALREAELGLSKLWGKKRIIAQLYAKGFSDDAVRSAADFLEDIDFIENCALLIKRNYMRQLNSALGDKNAMMKLVATLSRMGYSFSEIKEASDMVASD